jgi:hypothetical protein
LGAGEIGFESDTNKFKIGTGSTAWVSLPYASNVSPLTTKGDLYTYSTDNARLAVGANGETLVADSSASTGLRYQVPVNCNPILNSSFQVWQRGTSGTITSGIGYPSADRWNAWTLASGGSVTLSRQVTGDTTNLPNIQYCGRFQRVAGNTSGSTLILGQVFETVNSIPYAGKTVTVSFYARKGADYSSASDLLKVQLLTNTTTDLSLNGMFSGATDPIDTSVTLTSTWQRFTATATIATNVTQLSLIAFYDGVGTAGADDYFEITGIQLEVGSVATPFKTYAGTIQGELAACQRYAINLNYNPSGKASYNTIANGFANSTTAARIAVNLPVAMRTEPSSITTINATSFVLDNIASTPAITTITINQGGTTTIFLTANVASGLTSGQNVTMYSNSDATASVILSAEL